MVDATDSKSVGRKVVGVRVPPPVPTRRCERYRRVDTVLGRKIPVDGVAYLDDLRKAADSVDLEETVDWLASHFA